MRLDLDWGNLRAALGHLTADQRTGDVLRLGAALHRFALSRGHTEVLDQLRLAIGQAGREPDAALIRALLSAASLISVFLRKEPGERDAAQRYAETGLAMARELGDQLLEVRSLGMLAAVRWYLATWPARGSCSVPRLSWPGRRVTRGCSASCWTASPCWPPRMRRPAASGTRCWPVPGSPATSCSPPASCTT